MEAVTLLGRCALSSGSTMPRVTAQPVPEMLVFMFFSVSVMVPPGVHSLPVPAVVGMTIRGTLGFVTMPVRPKYCRRGGGLVCSSLAPLAVSRELPPPMPTTPSTPSFAPRAPASSTDQSGGSACTLL